MKFEKFRKKPVVIEAFQLTEYHLNKFWLENGKGHQVSKIRGVKVEFRVGIDSKPNALIIPTLEGNHTAEIDDWIIQGVEGELYPCKPRIFQKTYEKATPNSSRS